MHLYYLKLIFPSAVGTLAPSVYKLGCSMKGREARGRGGEEGDKC